MRSPRAARPSSGRLLIGLCLLPLTAAPAVQAAPSTRVAGPTLDEEVWENAAFGVRIALPFGWEAIEEPTRGELLRVRFAREVSGVEQVTLRVYGTGAVGGALGAQQLTASAARASADNSEPQLGQREYDGVAAPTLEVELLAQTPPLRLRHLYLEHAQFVLVLESIAPIDAFEGRREVVRALWSGLERFEPTPDSSTAEAAERAQLEALASRCGRDVRWASDWEQAAGRAREERKPVLVCLRSYRGFQISDPNLSGIFMDEGWIDLVNTRTVPLQATRAADLPFASFDRYGLSGSTFGATWLLVRPDGEVIGDHPYPVYEGFADALRGLDELPGDAIARGLAGDARAAAYAERGWVEEAFEASSERPEGRRLRVELARRTRDGQRMLAELDAMERQALTAEEAGWAATQRVQALCGLGRPDEARAALVRMREEHGEREGRAGLLAARLDWCAGDLESAERELRAVIEGWPESDQASLAAATLLSTGWQVGLVPRLGWPEARDVIDLRPPVYAPLPVARARAARARAVEWLLENQRPDGLWFEPASAGRAEGAAPHDFQLATSALALRALMHAKPTQAVERAIERGVESVLEGWEAQRRQAPEAYFMDYAVWSRAMLLDLLADLAERPNGPGAVETGRARALARIAFEELRARTQPNGGWSYYLTTDLDAASANAQSISFTTAGITLALLRARRAELLEGDDVDGTLEGALDQLERMRDADGDFAYMQPPGVSGTGDVPAPGSAGRAPVCTLALVRGGRVGTEALERALDRLVEQRATYAREVGRALMHTGADGQGSHYLLWDYAMAAEAADELPGRSGRRYREPLLEELLRTRLDDGAYLGSPLLGRAHGTAEAARAFAHLDV